MGGRSGSPAQHLLETVPLSTGCVVLVDLIKLAAIELRGGQAFVGVKWAAFIAGGGIVHWVACAPYGRLGVYPYGILLEFQRFKEQCER